jgi:hypothetical protein
MLHRLAPALFALAALPLHAQEHALEPLEVRPSPAYQAAVEKGTRSSSGEAGSKYWQQEVAYAIRATVDPGLHAHD